MVLLHRIAFLVWCTCLISLLLLAAIGSSSFLPDASSIMPLFESNPLSKDTKSISEADQFMYVVTVDPTASDDKSCHPPNQQKSNIVCKNLSHVLQMYHNISSVKFHLAAPEEPYYLNFTCNITNQHNVWFYGNSSLPQALIPKVKCLGDGGFSFTNSTNLSISYVEFINCGTIQKSSSTTSIPTIRVGLYFYNCTNVTILQVRVHSSQGIGVAMYDTDGKVEIFDSTFANNSVHTQYGGGGFAVEFTYCKTGDSTCNDRRNRDSIYYFHNCTFQENSAINLPMDDMSKYGHDATGEGGGLSIHITGDAKNNSFSLTECQFKKNGAIWGGGLHIEMEHQSTNNSIKISGCDFFDNGVVFDKDTYTGGGAIDAVITTHHFNQLLIEDCNFTNNTALQGGAICFFIARQDGINIDHPLQILIADSLFDSNNAMFGSAMVISNFPLFTSGIFPDIQICDSNFSNNHYLDLKDVIPVHPVGIAAVYISEIPVSFQNDVIFSSNIGSALTAIGTQLNFIDTTAYFGNNLGADGGAIALLGDAFILVGPTTNMTFVDNNATRYGGAIYNRYIRGHVMSTADCFIRYSVPYIGPDSWTAHINFSGNQANTGGCSIYTSSIIPCEWKFGSNYWEYWHYDRNNAKCKYNNEIFTEPKKFNFSTHNQNLSDPIEIFPGRTFTLPLGAYDDFDNNVTNQTIYTAKVLDGNSKSLAEVEHGFNYIISNYMSITGKPGSNIKLQLQTEDSRTMHVVLNMKIKNCPPGFVCSENNTDCSCIDSISNVKEIRCQCPTDKYTYQGKLRCIANSEHFHSTIDIRYWYGSVPINETVNATLMGRIPHLYRYEDDASDTIVLPKHVDEVDMKLCGNVHRRGVLCGECIHDYAVAVNSLNYECVLCNVTTTNPGKFIEFLFAYITLTYLPIMVFFILIISFDIKLASSAGAGFVLYAQIISSGNFLYPQAPGGTAQVIHTILMTIYGIFNLESFAFLMEPFCLNRNFTTLHVLSLDYAMAVFPLVIIVIIYLPYKCKLLCCKCHRQKVLEQETETSVINHDQDSRTSVGNISTSQRPCCTKPPKSTLIHAFTAFMLLSYTKFGLASMKTVLLTELFDAQGATTTQRILLAGHLSFNNHQFLLPFGILAILVLVFIVFLPPLLLLGPIQFIDWLADKPRFRFIHKFWPSITIHIFLDTFQGYKPNRRFFAGLYLLFRLVLFLTFSFSPDLLSQYTAQLIVILIFFALISLLRPYTNEYYNSLDILLFLNLGILNIITNYVREYQYTTSIYTLECILIFLPLIYMIFALWNKARKSEDYKKVKERIGRRLVNPVKSSAAETEKLLKSNGDDPLDESINYSSDDPDEEIFQRAAKGNRFRSANIQTFPPSRPGGVHKTVVSIQDPQMPRIDEDEETSSTNRNDSGIGRQSSSGRSTYSDN